MTEAPKYEKVYLVTNVRSETKDLIAVELLDETSDPQRGIIKRLVLFVATDDYLNLLQKPVPTSKLKVTIVQA